MRLLLKTLTRIPLWVLYTWSGVLYFVTFHLLRWRRDRAEADIARAFPEKSAVERALILRDSYRNLADTLMEAFWGFGASRDALQRRVTVGNLELVKRLLDEKQSIVLLTAHFGNWEWQSLAAGVQFGVIVDVVYQPLRLEAADQFFKDARSRFGARLVPRKEFIFDLMSRAGQPRIYALLADQTPKGKDPRHWTEFLHQDTAFFVGAGKIARFLEAKVVYVSMRRVARGRYVMDLNVMAEPPYDETADAFIVEEYARRLEREIRTSPADWLWLQNKWKYARPNQTGKDVEIATR